MPYSIDSSIISRFRNYLEQHQSLCLDLLQQMVAINSFTANPIGVNKLGRLTAEIFAELGFTSETVQCPVPAYGKHLVLTRPGRTGRKIGLVSHLDTVFPPDEEERHNFVWRQEDDRIYGPGTIDIKGGTVLIYMMLAALQEIAPRAFENITWVILFNAAEETVAVDFSNLCLERLAGDTLGCLIFETGHVHQNKNKVVVARKGMALYRITAEGRATHAGSAHPKGASAILQLAHTVQAIEALTDYERQLTFNVGSIAGGTVINRVPHFAAASGEMRAFSPAVYDEALARLLDLPNQASVRSPEDGYLCKVKINVFDQTPPWPRNESTDRLLSIWQAAAHSLDMQVIPEERGGLSDGNQIWPHIPTIDGLGPSGQNAHCSEQSADGSKEQEYVIPSSFVPKALLNIIATLNLINTAG